MANEKVDAVIVDCDAPGTRDFLRKLRTAPLGSAPVIIASGSANGNGLRGTGATFIVEKPVSVEHAVHTLSAARNMILDERLRYHRYRSSTQSLGCFAALVRQQTPHPPPNNAPPDSGCVRK